MKVKQTIAAVALALLAGGTVSAAPILWIDDSQGQLGKVDVATGGVTVVGTMKNAAGATIVMTDIAFDPTGNLWGINFNQLYRIDTTTAAATLVGNFAPTLNSLVFGADGTLYSAGNALYTLNTATGAATLLGAGGGYNSSGDLAFVGGNLYLSSCCGDSLYRLNPANGAGTFVGNIGFGGVYGLATDNNINLFGVSGTNVLSINTTTGSGSVLVNYGGKGLFDAWGTAFLTEAGAPPTGVPEPASLALLGFGLLGISRLRRRG